MAEPLLITQRSHRLTPTRHSQSPAGPCHIAFEDRAGEGRRSGSRGRHRVVRPGPVLDAVPAKRLRRITGTGARPAQTGAAPIGGGGESANQYDPDSGKASSTWLVYPASSGRTFGASAGWSPAVEPRVRDPFDHRRADRGGCRRGGRQPRSCRQSRGRSRPSGRRHAHDDAPAPPSLTSHQQFVVYEEADWPFPVPVAGVRGGFGWWAVRGCLLAGGRIKRSRAG